MNQLFVESRAHDTPPSQGGLRATRGFPPYSTVMVSVRPGCWACQRNEMCIAIGAHRQGFSILFSPDQLHGCLQVDLHDLVGFQHFVANSVRAV